MNGLTRQWGKKAYSEKTVTLPIPYSNTNYAILVAGYYPATTNAGMIIDSSSGAKTSNSFKVFGLAYSDGGYYWETIGY